MNRNTIWHCSIVGSIILIGYLAASLAMALGIDRIATAVWVVFGLLSGIMAVVCIILAVGYGFVLWRHRRI